MKRFFLERLVSGRRHSAVAGMLTGLLTQPQGSRGGCSSLLRSEEGEAVCCVLHCKSPLRPNPNGRRLRLERTAVLRWFLSV